MKRGDTSCENSDHYWSCLWDGRVDQNMFSVLLNIRMLLQWVFKIPHLSLNGLGHFQNPPGQKWPVFAKYDFKQSPSDSTSVRNNVILIRNQRKRIHSASRNVGLDQNVDLSMNIFRSTCNLRWKIELKRQVPSMIHLARPTVLLVANTILTRKLFCVTRFEKWGRTYGRTTCVKIVITTGRDRGSAS